jgi:GON domain
MSPNVQTRLFTWKAGLVLGSFLMLMPHAAMAALPATCADIKAASPGSPDGTYTITNNGKQFQVYCKGMAGTPAEYLSLVNTGAGQNFSQYTAGGATPGTNVVTSYTKVRLNPSTLLVDISDQSFTTSTGTLTGPGSVQVTSMPYGTAMACISGGNAAGLANIDLTGTPFTVNDIFATQGAAPAGSAVLSSSNHVVSITGGGFCGWTVPEGGFNPINNFGTFQLQLAFTPPPVTVPALSDGALILLVMAMAFAATIAMKRFATVRS